jgi:GntR family transcriptional regulator, transcriptional repressor for pyruvate dehydrogenase complex
MERDAALEAVFMPVQPASTFEETVERLGSAIRLGLLAPGAQLPPERELATRLRISRSTLRQALTALVQSGHLISQRGRSGGTFVAEQPPLSEGTEEPLDQGA